MPVTETAADSPAGTEDTTPPDSAPLTPLIEPRDGLPTVITSTADLHAAAASLRAGTGPVALDAERASGHRYGQRAYLIQLRRAGSGTFLIDPVAQPDLGAINDALIGVPWVLHAASQDLACLEEVGLHPDVGLFDTELAARILGRPRVGLGPLVADVLGFALAKEHSAVDWSTRPLRRSWLIYAALDVEVLLELADALRGELDSAGKSDVLAQECAHVIVQAHADALPKPDPWRRTSGLHRIRNRRGLAVVRELWNERDTIARIHDVHPSRILPDAAIVAAAQAMPQTFDELEALPEFATNGARRNQRTWWRAIKSVAAAGEDELPVTANGNDAPPPPRSWAQRDPVAWARLEVARTAVARISQDLNIPVENLLKPDLLRRVCWQPPPSLDVDTIASVLTDAGARAWQVSLVAPELVKAWQDMPSVPSAVARRPSKPAAADVESIGSDEDSPRSTSPAQSAQSRAPSRRRTQIGAEQPDTSARSARTKSTPDAEQDSVG